MTGFASPAPAGLAQRSIAAADVALRAAGFVAAASLAVAAVPDVPALTTARWLGSQIVAGNVSLAAAGPGWLGMLAAWALGPGGSALQLIAAAAVAVALLVAVDARVVIRGAGSGAWLARIAVLACAIEGVRAGGSAVAALFASLLALALERASRRRTVCAVVLALVWCNARPDGLLAVAIAGAFALGALGAAAGERRERWIAFAGCVAAAFATPSFVALPLQAATWLRIDRTLADVVPVHPADIAPAGYRIGFTLVMVALVAFGSGGRLRARDAVLLAIATLLALSNGAFVPVFGALVAPLLANVPPSLAVRASLQPLRVDGAFAAACVLLACLAAPALARRADAAAGAQPYALVDAVSGYGAHRWFCANADWCGYVLARGPRGTTAVLDGRLALYPPDALATQRAIAHVARDWRTRLDAQRIDALLVRRDRALATLLASGGGWRIAASDATAAAFVRTRALP